MHMGAFSAVSIAWLLFVVSAYREESYHLSPATGTPQLISFDAQPFRALHSNARKLLDLDTASSRYTARSAQVEGFFDVYSAYGVTNVEKQLRLDSEVEDTTFPGWRVRTYQQIHNNIPIDGVLLKVVFNHEDHVVVVSGVTVPLSTDFNTQPSPGMRQRSVAIALNYLNAKMSLAGRTESLQLVANPDLIIHRIGLSQGKFGQSFLAYLVQLRDKTAGLGALHQVFVDAHSGQVLSDLLSARSMLSLTRRAFDDSHTGSTAPVWTEDDHLPASDELKQVLYATWAVHQLFKNMFNLELAGGTRNVTADVRRMSCSGVDRERGASYDRSSQEVRYCPGWGVPDIIAHEWAHAFELSQAFDKLVPVYQPGSLSEHFANVIGEAVQRGFQLHNPDLDYSVRTVGHCTIPTHPSVRWVLGESLPSEILLSRYGIGDLWNPGCISSSNNNNNNSDTMFQPNPQTTSQADCSPWDNGAVHTNSYIPSRVFAFLVDGGQIDDVLSDANSTPVIIPALGLVKTLHIYVRAKIACQIPTSTFQHHAMCLSQACRSLVKFGAESGLPLKDMEGSMDEKLFINQAECDSLDLALTRSQMHKPFCLPTSLDFTIWHQMSRVVPEHGGFVDVVVMGVPEPDKLRHCRLAGFYLSHGFVHGQAIYTPASVENDSPAHWVVRCIIPSRQDLISAQLRHANQNQNENQNLNSQDIQSDPTGQGHFGIQVASDTTGPAEEVRWTSTISMPNTPALSFTYYSLPRVYNVEPNRGSNLGGLLVTLHGVGFQNFSGCTEASLISPTDYLRVTMGGKMASVVSVERAKLIVRSPPSDFPDLTGTVPLSVSLNSARDIVHVPMTYAYIRSAQLSRLVLEGCSELMPAFASDVLEYTCEVHDQLTIDQQTEDPEASVSVSVYDGQLVEVVVTSAGQTEQLVYTIITHQPTSSLTTDNNNTQLLAFNFSSPDKDNTLSSLSVSNCAQWHSPFLIHLYQGFMCHVRAHVTEVTVEARVNNTANARVFFTSSTSPGAVSANSSYTVNNLPYGRTMVAFRVQALDSSFRHFRLVIVRDTRDTVELAGLVVQDNSKQMACELRPAFNPAIRNYSCSVDKSTTSLDVRAEVDFAATGATSYVLGQNDIRLGINYVEVVIIAEDRLHTGIYTVQVSRGYAEPRLLNVHIPHCDFTPPFHSEIYEYACTVSDQNRNLQPILEASPSSLIEIIGTNTTLGTSYLFIVASAQDGAFSRTYAWAVTRNPSSENRLRLLELSGCKIKPAFHPDQTNYTCNPTRDVVYVEVVALATLDPDSTVQVAKSYLGDLPLQFTEYISIVVTPSLTTSANNARKYTISLTRQYDTNTKLARLYIDGGCSETLKPSFSPDVFEYNCTVHADVHLAGGPVVRYARPMSPWGKTCGFNGASLCVTDNVTKVVRVRVTAEHNRTRADYVVRYSLEYIFHPEPVVWAGLFASDWYPINCSPYWNPYPPTYPTEPEYVCSGVAQNVRNSFIASDFASILATERTSIAGHLVAYGRDAVPTQSAAVAIYNESSKEYYFSSFNVQAVGSGRKYKFFFNPSKTSPAIVQPRLLSLSICQLTGSGQTLLTPSFQFQLFNYTVSLPFKYPGVTFSAVGMYMGDSITNIDTFFNITAGATRQIVLSVWSFGLVQNYTVTVHRAAGLAAPPLGMESRAQLALHVLSNVHITGFAQSAQSLHVIDLVACTMWPVGYFTGRVLGPYVCHLPSNMSKVELLVDILHPAAEFNFTADPPVQVLADGSEQAVNTGTPTSLSFGLNRFLLRIRDNQANGLVQAVYRFHVVRAMSLEARLASLSLVDSRTQTSAQIDCQPALASVSIHNEFRGPFRCSVPNALTAVEIQASTVESKARWTVFGDHTNLVSGRMNWLEVVVTADDQDSFEVYELEIHRALSSDASVVAMQPRAGCDLDPPYPNLPPTSPAFHDGKYVCWLDCETNWLMLDFVLGSARASVSLINNVDLPVGTSVVNALILAEDQEHYNKIEVLVIRKPSHTTRNDTGLVFLRFEECIFNRRLMSSLYEREVMTMWDEATNKSRQFLMAPYNCTVPNTVTSLTFHAILSDTDASWIARQPSRLLPFWNRGVAAVVTSEDGTRTREYYVDVYREPSDDTGLASISCTHANSSRLQRVFDQKASGITDLGECTINHYEREFSLDIQLKNPDSTLQLLYQAAAQLAVGWNNLQFTVTASSFRRRSTYQVKVYRKKSPISAATRLVLPDCMPPLELSAHDENQPLLQSADEPAYTCHLSYQHTRFAVVDMDTVETAETSVAMLNTTETSEIDQNDDDDGNDDSYYNKDNNNNLGGATKMAFLPQGGRPESCPNRDCALLLVRAQAAGNPSHRLTYRLLGNQDPLVVGPSTISLLTMAPDTEYSTRYRFLVIRDKPHQEAMLAEIVLIGSGSCKLSASSGFVPTQFEYGPCKVASSDRSVTIQIPVVSHSYPSGFPVSIKPSHIGQRSLSLGTSVLPVEVTAEDEITTVTYRFYVFRPVSDQQSTQVVKGLVVVSLELLQTQPFDLEVPNTVRGLEQKFISELLLAYHGMPFGAGGSGPPLARKELFTLSWELVSEETSPSLTMDSHSGRLRRRVVAQSTQDVKNKKYIYRVSLGIVRPFPLGRETADSIVQSARQQPNTAWQSQNMLSTVSSSPESAKIVSYDGMAMVMSCEDGSLTTSQCTSDWVHPSQASSNDPSTPSSNNMSWSRFQQLSWFHWAFPLFSVLLGLFLLLVLITTCKKYRIRTRRASFNKDRARGNGLDTLEEIGKERHKEEEAQPELPLVTTLMATQQSPGAANPFGMASPQGHGAANPFGMASPQSHGESATDHDGHIATSHGHRFIVRVSRPLGVILEKHTLTVSKIEEVEGGIPSWNAQHDAEAVIVGDQVVGIQVSTGSWIDLEGQTMQHLKEALQMAASEFSLEIRRFAQGAAMLSPAARLNNGLAGANTAESLIFESQAVQEESPQELQSVSPKNNKRSHSVTIHVSKVDKEGEGRSPSVARISYHT